MRILLINHYAGSPKHGMEYRPYYLAREWVRLGHMAQIVASAQSHVRSKQPQLGGRSVLSEVIDGVHYTWFKTPAYAGNSIGRVCNIAVFIMRLYREAKKLALSFKPEAVIASSTYPMDIWPAHRIAKMAGAELVFEVHDLWPLSPIELGGMSRKHPFIVLMQWAEDYAYRHADKVISMLPNAALYMKRHGMEMDKFVYIPNGIDAEHWAVPWKPIPLTHALAIENARQRGNFLLGYAGSHSISNALSTLVRVGQLIRGLKVTIVMVGKGAEKGNLRQLARNLGADNVIFLPPVEKQCIPALLSEMDALFIGWQKKSIYRFGISPNKLLDYMMAARPIIHSVEAANDMVQKAKCGISTAAEDPEAVAEAVKQMMGTSEEERSAMGRRGREYVVLDHNYAHLASKFIECIR